MGDNASGNRGRAIRLEVPLLIENPVVASGCCAVPAEDVLREELSWPGVTVSDIDTTGGRVDLQLSEEAPAIEKLIRGLESAGYPVAGVTTREDPAGTRATTAAPA